MITLIFKDITDQYVRENFKRILDYFRGDVWRRGNWQFFEVAFEAGATNFKFRHGLGFRPKDVLITGVTNSEAVTVNYDSNTDTFLDLTVSGACTVRFFAGTYRENLQ